MSEDTRAVAVVEEHREVSTYSQGRGLLAQMTPEQFSEKLEMLKLERQRIKKIQLEVMQEGTDYGKVPGTDRDTLLKPGQETLCDMYSYRLETRSTRTVGDNETAPAISWEVHTLVHIGDTQGPVVGDGWGSCNSWEVKYRYRNAGMTCPKCGQQGWLIKSTDFGTKQANGYLCWSNPAKGKRGCGAKFGLQDPAIINQSVGKVDNPDPWDLDNTLLKMAIKRSKVDATLSVCAASGLFTQDVEDMEGGEEVEHKSAAAAEPEKEPAKPATTRTTKKTSSAAPTAEQTAPAKDQDTRAYDKRPLGELGDDGKKWWFNQLKEIGFTSLAPILEARGIDKFDPTEIAGDVLEFATGLWNATHPPTEVESAAGAEDLQDGRVGMDEPPDEIAWPASDDAA